MQYEIVPYRTEFRDAVVRLSALRDPTYASAHMKWKYECNPYIETPLIYLAIHGDEVVGMRGAWGSRWEIGDRAEAQLVPCFGGLVIAPDHRDRGLLTEIMTFAMRDLCERGHPYALSLSAGSVTFLASRAMGWRGVAALDPMIRRSKANAAKQWLRRKVRGRPMLIGAYRRTRGLARQSGSPSSQAAAGQETGDRLFAVFDKNGARGRTDRPLVAGNSPWPQEMAALVARLPADGRLRHVRSEEYFAWRFQDPRRRYRFLFWEDQGLKGYLILGAHARSRAGHVTIVDWEAEDLDVRMRLLDGAVRWGLCRTVQIWSGGLPPAVQAKLLERRFRKEPIPSWNSAILVRPTCDETLSDPWTLGGRDLREPADWDFRMIYSDDY